MVHRDGSTISLLRGTDCSPARMALPAKLDSFSHLPHIKTRLVHISRVVGSTATTIEPSSSRNCEHFLEGVYLHCQYKNSLLGRLGAASESLCLID